MVVESGLANGNAILCTECNDIIHFEILKGKRLFYCENIYLGIENSSNND